MKRKKECHKIINDLEDSFKCLANEHRISRRWREHFRILFCELKEEANKRVAKRL